MHEAVLEGRGRWVAGTIGAVAVTVVLLLLFRFPAPTTSLSQPDVQPARKATVQLAGQDETDLLLKAETELRDLRPLFLPTGRNAALPEPRLEPGRAFLETDALPSRFSESEARITKDLPPVATLNGKPVGNVVPEDALSLRENSLSLQGFGRAPARVAVFEVRGAYLEVTGLKDGRHVFGEKLPAEARPPVDKAWAPIEFIAVVDAAGLVSPLVVTDGSRVDEVDAHFRNYLAQNFRVGERLSPGFYRITVAP